MPENSVAGGEKRSLIDPKLALIVEGQHHLNEMVLKGASLKELQEYQKGLLALQKAVGQ